ncbi:protein translocase subunit SecF [Anaerocaecibacter muris]|uniref:protein translocase subunit SecF n=1 Tax=Anaerocaecibacter muris TaxID=2941513 RepID=UPI00203F245A|nr:protein translocase subunit SecF [Anaerocaecibacter muris]
MKLKQKIDNLLDKDFKLVEKRKIIFAIPIVILVIAAVMMIIFHFTLGSALNLGTDFTGGYSVDIKLGNQLTDDNYQEYYDKITETLKSVKTENGKEYKITISGAMQRQGSGDNASIHVKYAAVNGVSESEMSKQINPAIISALEKSVLNKVPSVTIKDNVITATYDEPIDDTNAGSPFETLKNAFLAIVSDIGLTESDVDVKLNTENRKQIIITSSKTVENSSEVKDKIVSAMTLPDVYAGSVTGGDLVGATVSTELLFNAILAVSLALIFMLCYIGLRFQLSSGIACIIALLHDVLIMFAFMAIFNIEINSTFIAALITILGYSINNSIILFDRVRENMRTVYAKSMSPEGVANKSIKETLIRSINTTITTLIMILMIAIIGVSEIKIFAFPIIFGLLAGTFSSIFIAPSLWALFQRVGKNKQNFRIEPKNKNKKTEKKSKPTEIGA